MRKGVSITVQIPYLSPFLKGMRAFVERCIFTKPEHCPKQEQSSTDFKLTHATKQPTQNESLRVKQRLEEFMACDDRKILAINGPWGCGKTYFWNDFLHTSCTVREKKHAYVSLFDIASVQELKSKIFMTSIMNENSAWTTATSVAFAHLPAIVGKFPYLGEYLKSDVAGGAIIDFYLRDFLVCVDDIERRSPNMEIRQLMGFLSVLREHRGCRIVIILNEQQLNKDDEKVLNKYRDKIIDMEIRFTPTVRENAQIVLEGHEFSKQLLHVFEQAGVNNIRIMQKTIWRLRRLLKIVSNKHVQAREEMAVQLAILCCLHYSEDDRVDIRKVTGLKAWHSMLSDREPQEDSSLLSERLKALGWDFPQHENLLVNAILDEDYDEPALREAARRLQETYRHGELREEISLPLTKFRSGFQGDIEDIREALRRLLRDRTEAMNWIQLGQVLELLKTLGEEVLLTTYQERWLNANLKAISDDESFRMVSANIADPILKQKVAENASGRKQLDLIDCMVQVAYRNSWGGDVSDALKEATPEEFVDAFTKSADEDLLSLIQRFLSLATSFGKNEPKWEVCADRIRFALRSIEETSELNRIRIQKFFGSQLYAAPTSEG